MAAYLINIKLQSAEREAYWLLDTCMQRENFIPVNNTAADEKTYSYYGNQDLLHVTEAVQRAVLSTGKKFFFTVINNKKTEKQFHTSI